MVAAAHRVNCAVGMGHMQPHLACESEHCHDSYDSSTPHQLQMGVGNKLHDVNAQSSENGFMQLAQVAQRSASPPPLTHNADQAPGLGNSIYNCVRACKACTSLLLLLLLRFCGTRCAAATPVAAASGPRAAAAGGGP